MILSQKVKSTDDKSAARWAWRALILAVLLSGSGVSVFLTKLNESIGEQLDKTFPVAKNDKPNSVPLGFYESAEFDSKVMGYPKDWAKQNEKAEREFRASQTTADSGFKKYKVRPGDTAQAIANRNHIGVEELKKANPGVDWENLKRGQKLNIITTAGGNLAPTEPYSEKIPEAYGNKKVNKNTKAKKTKKTKVSSKKSQQMAELQEEKEKTEEKKETLQAVIDQKNSKQAKTNPKETQKKIDETINKSNLNGKEKKVAKEMSKEKDDKSLKEAKELLEKKEKILEVAIETNNPLYYYQWPREMHDFTFNKEQRDNSYAFFLLKAVNNGMGVNGIKIYEVPGIELQGWAVCYFLNLRTANFFSKDFNFKSNGETITNRRVYEELAVLLSKRDGIRNVYQQADVAYKARWHEWVERFGEK